MSHRVLLNLIDTFVLRVESSLITQAETSVTMANSDMMASHFINSYKPIRVSNRFQSKPTK